MPGMTLTSACCTLVVKGKCYLEVSAVPVACRLHYIVRILVKVECCGYCSAVLNACTQHTRTTSYDLPQLSEPKCTGQIYPFMLQDYYQIATLFVAIGNLSFPTHTQVPT